MVILALRRYLQGFLLTLGLALGLVCAVNAVVDPFGYRSVALLAIDQAALSEHSHNRLFRLASYSNSPKSIIVLGDSRAQNLKQSYFAGLGVDVANLAYGGGTLYEAIDTFWFANRIHRPTHVILGLPLNLWTEANNFNQVTEASSMLENPLRYYLSYYVFGISLRNIWLNATGATTVKYQPPSSREEFWLRQLGRHGIGQYYGRWREPVKLRQKFDRMVQYCRENNIQLTIVIPPTHVDLQEKIADYGLANENHEYLKTLAASGRLLNFDVVNTMTADSANFGDPFHANQKVMEEVTRTIVRELNLGGNGLLVSPASSAATK